MPDVATCPDLPSLKRFQLGQCAAADRESLAKHLEQCDRCRLILHTIQNEDGVGDAGKEPRTATPGEATVDAVSQASQAGTVPPSAPPVSQACDLATWPPAAASRGPGADVTLSRVPFSPPAATSETRDALYDFLAPPQNPGELGRLGPYHVLKVLGAGGMGVVFHAFDPHLERSVALKAMLPGLAASSSSRQRFLREAKAAAAIKHDHIVTIYQVGEDGGVPFLAMEFLEGESLDDRLKRKGKLWPHEVLRIGREMAEGLAAAHKRGLIHRDVKPGNVWLEGLRGRVKILDFGLVRLASDSGEQTLPGSSMTTFTDNSQLTQAGAIVGTPAFMAPEQADGKSVDARCDLFSLGCVLYQMATGKLPFQGGNMFSTLMAVATETPPPPQTLNPELSPEVCDLVMHLLAKDPADRPASASRVVAIIDRIEALAQKREAERTVRETADASSYAALTAARVAALPEATEGNDPNGSASSGSAQTPGASSRRPGLSRRVWIPVAAVALLWTIGLMGYLLESPAGLKHHEVSRSFNAPAGPPPVPNTGQLAIGGGIPDLISYQPQQLPTACIAVQATREDFELFTARNFELVVVLDYSASMNTPQPDGKRRIDKALDALKECLMGLPKGVRLTVLTYSANSNADIVVQRENSPWEVNQLVVLMDKLRRLSPQGITPLVRATAEAAKHFTANFKGAKMLIVLTDGGDDQFNHPTAGADLRAEAPTIAKYLHMKFDGTGIQLAVIGFQQQFIGETADEIAIWKEYLRAIMDIGGVYASAPGSETVALVDVMERFIQVHVWVEDEGGNLVESIQKEREGEGVRVSLDTETLRPIKVPAPGSYYVVLQTTHNQKMTGLGQHVHVEPGEALVLDLNNAPNKDGQFDLRRDLYAKSHGIGDANAPVVEPLPVGKDWMLTILGNTKVQNKSTPRDTREITLSVEGINDSTPPGGTVRQARPKLIWFNVAKESDRHPIPWLRFYPLPNYPAPVWRLELAEPSDGALVLDAWWYENLLPGGLSLRKGQEFQSLSDLTGRAFSVRPTEDDARTNVLVERVSIEPRMVEVQPRNPQFLDCLIVSLRYPEGRPYFVQLPDDIRPLGNEQRFDAVGNRYTGVFFGVSVPQVENLAWLKLISVEEAHRKAVRVDGVAIRRDGAPPLPIDK